MMLRSRPRSAGSRMESTSMLSIFRKSIGDCCWWIGCCGNLPATCVGDTLSRHVQRVLSGSSAGCEAVVVKRTALDILTASKSPSRVPSAICSCDRKSHHAACPRATYLHVVPNNQTALKQAAYHAPQQARTSHPAPQPTHSSSSSASAASPHRFPHSAPPSSDPHS